MNTQPITGRLEEIDRRLDALERKISALERFGVEFEQLARTIGDLKYEVEQMQEA